MLSIVVSLLLLATMSSGFPELCVVLCYVIGMSVQHGSYSLCNVSYVDGMSQVLIILSVYISLLMLVVSLGVEWVSVFVSCVIMICICLVIAFSAVNVFFFYSAFEGVLIPTMVLILGWGYQPERIQAVVYMVVYTVFGSLPFLYGMALVASEKNVIMWGGVWSAVSKSVVKGSLVYTLAFLTKLPVFPFYLWLPKAHVEAPLAGSMILAGLLLKLGGYGLVRLSGVIAYPMSASLSSFVAICGLYGGVLTSVMCLQQSDLKALVAFSSIGHMSLVFYGVISGYSWGFAGAVALMVGHGLCSSGMFVGVDAMYQSSGSRAMIMNKGFLVLNPVLSTFFFLVIIGNIPAPLSLNLFGEVLVFSVGASTGVYVVVILGLMSFLSGCFNFYLYGGTQHGKSSGVSVSRLESGFLTSMVLLCHWLPLNLLVFVFPWVV
uniref:NADH-ubiquinone oxidoreductase chain 4 n=1 Tax=Lithophaga curta TaxID=2590090 RepID=A0A516EZH1_9BIVA|nr:NADH dehydrogenase subunit 4 [Lithophaga curta]